MLLGTVACGDDDDDSSKTPTKPDDSTSGGKGGGKAGTKAPPVGGAGSKAPPVAGKDAGPTDAGCMIDSGDPDRRLEERCAKGRCPASLEDVAMFIDEDAGCHHDQIECCGIVTVHQDCAFYWESWTFDQKTGALIGESGHGDAFLACEPANWSGTYVHDCADARAKGLCDAMDGGL